MPFLPRSSTLKRNCVLLIWASTDVIGDPIRKRSLKYYLFIVGESTSPRFHFSVAGLKRYGFIEHEDLFSRIENIKVYGGQNASSGADDARLFLLLSFLDLTEK